MSTYTLIYYRQTGHGTYRVTIEDEHGERHSTTTHDAERIDAIREAGRDMASNDDGTFDRLKRDLAEAVANGMGLE